MATRVQFKHAYTGSTTTTLTTDGSVTAGNLLILACSWNGPTNPQTTSASDNRGTTYTSIDIARASTNFTQVQLFYGYPTSSGSCTINVASQSDMGLTVVEYAGLPQAQLILTSGQATGMNAAPSITLLGYEGGIFFGAYANESTPNVQPSPVSPATQIQWDSGHADAQYEKFVTANGIQTIGYTIGTQYNNQAFIGAAFGIAQPRQGFLSPDGAGIV